MFFCSPSEELGATRPTITPNLLSRKKFIFPPVFDLFFKKELPVIFCKKRAASVSLDL